MRRVSTLFAFFVVPALLVGACSSDPSDADGDPNGPGGSSGSSGSGSGADGAPPVGYEDGIQNEQETDIDCGGPVEAPGFKPCDDGKKCLVGTDCRSLVCDEASLLCSPPSYTDGVKNGDESDVDCGGDPANQGWVGCAVSAACNDHRDCTSDGCSYEKKCVQYRSCTAHFGGDTCGSGEVTDPQRQHESCCETIPVTSQGGVQLEKYNITAGRMRVFVERTGGDIQGWLGQNKPTWWNDAWTEYLPTGMNTPLKQVGTVVRNLGVYGHLGPNFLYDQTGTFGCWSGSNDNQGGAPTYWIPTAERKLQNVNDAGNKYPQELLDQKPINCADFLLVAAFCAWDGGRMPSIQEIDGAWNGDDGTRTYPWGNAPVPAGYTSGYPTPGTPSNYNPTNGDPNYANFRKNFPKTGGEFNYTNYDLASYISPPGRFPLGAGPYGHMDLAGSVFNVTMPTAANTDDPTTVQSRWSRSGSWETAHGIPYQAHSSPLLRKYWAQGGRCVKP